MRDFSWKYFAMTGDVEAYMLYREYDKQDDEVGEQDDLMQEDNLEALS